MSAASSGKKSCQYAFASYASAWLSYSFHVRALCPFRTSPGGWSLPNDHSKMLAQMRLIHKATAKRNVAQTHIGLKHVFGSQFDATPDHKGVGGVSEYALKGARKVRFAATHQST